MRKIFSIQNLLLLAAATLSSLTVVMTVANPHASALSGSDFVANRIIDDAVFYNGNALTAAEIQNFLNSKVPSCDTQGNKLVFDPTHNDTVTRKVYSQRRGISTPFTCLKDYVGSYNARSDSGLCSHISAASNRSAAQIIDTVARACNISQKALIVMLEKEQSLVTDDWPWPVQYEKAMGYYCPDDPNNPGWCHPDYAGFFNQVYNAAKQFQRYKLFPEDFNHALGRTSFVAYQANAPGCGGTNLTMQTAATAGLYNYTPYQPNAAALQHLYGTGDACSAYGNRNFWRLFNDWFGSTYAPNYSWWRVNQQVYVDEARTKPVNPGLLSPDTTYYARVTAKNTGNRTWKNSGANPVMLGTSHPGERASIFCDKSWFGCNRAAKLKEAEVLPGGTGTFEFSIKTPSNHGTHHEYFNLLAEGEAWMNDIGFHWSFGIKPSTYQWSFAGQSIHADSDRTVPVNPKLLAPNTTYHLQLKARNTGNVTWQKSGSNPVRLGTNVPIDRNSAFCNGSWGSCNRPTALQESSVEPGGIGTFNFSITTPNRHGEFKEYFRLVAEGKAWMNDLGQHWALSVKPPTYAWKFAGQAVYTDSTKAEAANINAISGNQRVYVVIRAQNTGNVTWQKSGSNPVRLGTNVPIDRPSKFCDPSWGSCNRPTAITETSVAPGEIGTFEFWAKAPYALDGTSFSEYFRPVAEGKMWMNDLGQHITFKMDSPDFVWEYQGQQTFLDSNRTQAANLNDAKPNTTYYLRLRAKNISGRNWSSSTRLGTSNPVDRISSFCDNSWINCNRAARLKESKVRPGEIGTFEFSVKTPASTGTYNEYFRPVIDGVAWLNDVGLHWKFVVKP